MIMLYTKGTFTIVNLAIRVLVNGSLLKVMCRLVVLKEQMESPMNPMMVEVIGESSFSISSSF